MIQSFTIFACRRKRRKNWGVFIANKKEAVAIVFGGSVLAPSELRPHFLKEVATCLKRSSENRQLFVVVGGGFPARKYIEAGRVLGVSEEDLDRVGIQATRLNAQILACILQSVGADVNLEIPTRVSQALLQKHNIVVMGGTEPGHSTDYVAVELAIAASCVRLVNATNVKGVYTSDPAKDLSAKLIPQMTFQDLPGIIKDFGWVAAGSPGVLDGPATELLMQKSVPTRVVLGTDLANLRKAIAGEVFRGTSIEKANGRE